MNTTLTTQAPPIGWARRTYYALATAAIATLAAPHAASAAVSGTGSSSGGGSGGGSTPKLDLPASRRRPVLLLAHRATSSCRSRTSRPS